MCMEDVELGRATVPHYSVVVLKNGSDTELVPARPERVALYVRAITNGSFQACPKNAGAGPTEGMLVTTSSPPIDLNIERHGAAVATEWRGAGVAADVTVLVIESLLRRK